MSFFNKAKQAAEQAAAKVQEGVEDVQQKRELSQAYSELGKTAFALIESGELSHSGSRRRGGEDPRAQREDRRSRRGSANRASRRSVAAAGDAELRATAR